MGQWWVIFGHFYLNHLSPLWGYFFEMGKQTETMKMRGGVQNSNIDLLYVNLSFKSIVLLI